jgi:hypothetical protein
MKEEVEVDWVAEGEMGMMVEEKGDEVEEMVRVVWVVWVVREVQGVVREGGEEEEGCCMAIKVDKE